MSRLTENPVLLREVRSRLRWRRIPMKTLLRAGAVVSVLAVLCYSRLITLIARGRADDASMIWWVIIYGLLVLIALLAPALAATAISQEREQQTWEGLVVTRLTPLQILAGKWAARQMLLGIALLILSPLMIAVAVKGQVPWMEALMALFVLVFSSGFYSSIGMFCSFVARRTAAATATALVVVVFLCLGTVVVNEIICSFQTTPNYTTYTYDHQLTPMLWLNPFCVMVAIQSSFSNTYDVRSVAYGDTFSREIMTWGYLTLTMIFIGLIFSFMIARYRKPSREG